MLATPGRLDRWLGWAGVMVCVCALLFSVSLLAIKSAWLSGGTLVVWPADGLILGLMLTSSRRRLSWVMAAGLVGALLAFCVDGLQMILASSRVCVMALTLPLVHRVARSLTQGRAIAETRVLLPFLLACTLICIPAAFLRAAVLHLFWGFPIAQLTLTTSTATFVGYAVVTPLTLLLCNRDQGRSGSRQAKARMSVIIGFYSIAMTFAFFEQRYPTAYLIPLGLILVAHLVDFLGIAIVIVVTAAVAVGLTFSGHGPISQFAGDMKEKVLIMQGFLTVMICTTLPFSALMSDRDRLRKSLVAALEEARNASRAKSTFLATVSHEIRTPLNGVLGMAQAIEMDELTAVQRERIAVVRSSGESLLSLLNDILDLSKIEAGKLTFETIEFDPARLVQAVVAQNQVLAANKGLKLRAVTDGVDGVWEGDPNRIRQIVQNLVSNAIKFSEAGNVTVTAILIGQVLTVRVRDCGIGIPADKLGALFQRFRQVDESTTRRFGGTGLGLSICQELAKAMGGDVTADSVAGVGSTFTLTMPLSRSLRAPAASSPHQGADRPSEFDLRVVAAEDNATNQLVLRTLLGAAGVTPTIVGNGAEAVAAWRDGNWDVILMDVQMPVMDGLTAAGHIRKAEADEGRARTIIVALTANAMDHHVQAYLDVGMDGYLSKPISVDDLFALLASVQSAKTDGRAWANHKSDVAA